MIKPCLPRVIQGIGLWIFILCGGFAVSGNAGSNFFGIEKKAGYTNFNRLVAGTYIVSRDPQAGESRILTIFADGNLSSIQSTQFAGGAGGLAFSDQQGVWKRIGYRNVKATVLNLNFLEGQFSGIAVADYYLQFNDNFSNVTGEVDGRIYEPGVDPQNPGDAEPLAVFTDQFVAQRVFAANGD